MKRRFVIGIGVLVVAGIASASANPRPLPFSHPYETRAQGKVEVQQFMDFVPIRVERERLGMPQRVWGVRSVLTTAVEVGLTDNLELGFHLQSRQDASGSTPTLRFDGVRQRLHYRFAETGELPVDIGLNLEIAELHNVLAFVERLVLSKRLGDVILVANLGVEQAWYFQESTTALGFSPSVGGAYEISPRFDVGLEYWARGRFDEDPIPAGDDTPTTTHHYLGPTFLFHQGPIFLALGVYARMDALGQSTTVGDPFGKIWIRSILGLDL